MLIDGSTLAKLMIENRVGVATTDTLKIGKIDEDYFEQEEARRPYGRGLSVVVEVRRLELLTPYMRSKCSTS